MAEPRLKGVSRGAELHFEFDGERIAAHEGETVAMALYAAGQTTIRRSARLGSPRGVFCNMGICYECLVYLEGRAVRACMTPVADGMRLRTWGPQGGDSR